jgi:hypothetical protein
MEILVTTEIMQVGWGILLFFAIIAAGCFGLFGICGMIFDQKYLSSTILLLICLILIIAAIAIGNIPEKITQHKVIISDMESFDHDKYEIISNEGKLFTINENK